MTRGQENNEVQGQLIVLRRWCLGLTAALGIVLLAGAAASLQQIVCRSLEVKDERGITHVAFYSDGKGDDRWRHQGGRQPQGRRRRSRLEGVSKSKGAPTSA